jgi:hypothetical protein
VDRGLGRHNLELLWFEVTGSKKPISIGFPSERDTLANCSSANIWTAPRLEHETKPPQISSESGRTCEAAKGQRGTVRAREKDFLMVWLLIAISICAIAILAGRAHSRYLDRLEAKIGAVVQIQLLSLLPDVESAPALAPELAPETGSEVPFDWFSGIRVVNQPCILAKEAEDRSLDCGIRLISDEGELLEAHDLRQLAVAASRANAIANRGKESGRKIELALALFCSDTATR